MIIYSYNDFERDSIALAGQIKNSGIEFSAILGIARGGLALAQFLSYLLGVRACLSLSSISYGGDQKIHEPRLAFVPALDAFERVLIVDDIIDSGESMKVVFDTLKSRFECDFHTAALFYKTTACFKPEFFINPTQEWIQFPWEYELDEILARNNEQS